MSPVEIAEIVENLHRQDLAPTERLAAMKRLAELDVILSDQAAKEACAKPEESSSPIAQTKKRPRNQGVGKGANQKKGHKPGSSRALADKFGVDQKTAHAYKKKIDALTGNDIVNRIAKLPQFDERGAIGALAKMDVETREATVAKAEAGEKVKMKKADKPHIAKVASPTAPVIIELTLRDQIVALFDRIALLTSRGGDELREDVNEMHRKAMT